MIEETSKKIVANIEKMVDTFAESIYNRRNIYKSQSYFPREYLNVNIKTRHRLSACENKNRVEGVPEEEIVYYNDENGKIYCFTVNQLLTQFLDNDIKNPDTNLDFTQSFF